MSTLDVSRCRSKRYKSQNRCHYCINIACLVQLIHTWVKTPQHQVAVSPLEVSKCRSKRYKSQGRHFVTTARIYSRNYYGYLLYRPQLLRYCPDYHEYHDLPLPPTRHSCHFSADPSFTAWHRARAHMRPTILYCLHCPAGRQVLVASCVTQSSNAVEGSVF